MNENIITYIKDNYIKSKMEPKFAVLIKGDWGCGKTFLVKEILKENYRDDYKKNVVWLSVYGLSSIAQLRQKLFEALHPILTNKITKFVFEAVKAGLKASTNFDFNNDGKDDISFDLAIPDFELEENGKKSKIKKLLVVDDMERCSIPMSELFGFFSEEILEKNVRAIFISNDVKIKELNIDNDTLNDYKS
ncbi:MAG: KAP family NTPase, partial [Treponemataceae bacterium]|nr:KAP family NTPase [Treponemataceae bacterium]